MIAHPLFVCSGRFYDRRTGHRFVHCPTNYCSTGTKRLPSCHHRNVRPIDRADLNRLFTAQNLLLDTLMFRGIMRQHACRLRATRNHKGTACL